jgi:hypothetical protein
MSKLRERLYVRCPLAKAPSLSSFYLDQLARKDRRDGTVIRLEVPLSEFGIPSGLKIRRDVIAHFVPLNEKEFGARRTAIDWAPAGGGPYPKFLGFISVEQGDDGSNSWLVLEGFYTPPLGPVGAAFDAVMGHRIAQATAHELLRALGRRLENDWSAAPVALVR